MLHASMLDYAETDDFYAEDLHDTWTPKRVRERMVEAFDVLRRIPVRIGPQAFGSNWPQVLQEFADLIDKQAWWQRQSEAERGGWRRPTIDEISRMEEAIGWPGEHVEAAIQRDALNVWAMADAWSLNLAGIMRARAKAAADLARVMERDENARRRAARAQEAARVAAWGNARLDRSDGSAEARERIRANAMIRLSREVEDLRPVLVKPSQAMPDKVLSRTSMDRHGYRAMMAIAVGLEAKGARVR